MIATSGRNSRNMVATFAALALTACGPAVVPCTDLATVDVDAIYDTLWADYGAEYGFGVEACEYLRPDETRIVAQGVLPQVCTAGAGRRSRGCAELEQGRYVVWVRQCDPDPTFLLRHEGLHVLLSCEEGDTPANVAHEGAEWDVLGVR